MKDVKKKKNKIKRSMTIVTVVDERVRRSNLQRINP